MEKDIKLQETRKQIEFLENTLARALRSIPHKCNTCGKGFHGELGFDCRDTVYKSGYPDCLSWEWNGIKYTDEDAAKLNGYAIYEVWNVIASFHRGCIEAIPSKVGDTVFEVRDPNKEVIMKSVIKRIECDENGWRIWHTPEDCNPNHLFSVKLQDFRDRFFQTMEEAEFTMYERKDRR